LIRRLAVALALIAAATQPAQARVIEFKVVETLSPAMAGRAFGAVGRYELLTARVRYAIDPADRRHGEITDLALAPRDADGTVGFAGEMRILKPVDLARASGTLLADVPNRGSKPAPGLFNDVAFRGAFTLAGDGGNGFLMEAGHVLAWASWQHDVPALAGLLAPLEVPRLAGVTGVAREEYVFDHRAQPAQGLLAYPVADRDPARASLSVRAREADARRFPADLRWSYRDDRSIAIERPRGFDAGAIYEFIYPARDPRVSGLGFAATRDLVAFLRRERHDAAGNANPPLADGESAMRRAIGFGLSQSGRYLRDFVHEGFNEDEEGRIVLDGVIAHVAGARRTSLMERWSQPGRYSRQHEEHLFPGDQFPFTYATTIDARTGRTDAILARCATSGTCPRLFHVDSATEVWQARSSLIVTDPEGRPVDPPANVRVYLLSSTPHGVSYGAKSEETPSCVLPSNPLHAGAVMRALLVAMERWIAEDTMPPASRFSSLRDRTLVAPEPAAMAFPSIPGLDYTGQVNRLRVVDHATQPPRVGASYPVLVAKVDADGHDVAGIRLPAIDAPLGTHLGWNLRRPDNAPGELCSLAGGFVPFAATRSERLSAGDARLSLEERYPTHADYVAAVRGSAMRLARERLLLAIDADRITAAAERASIGRPRN
jgi:hypothetical protein